MQEFSSVRLISFLLKNVADSLRKKAYLFGGNVFGMLFLSHEPLPFVNLVTRNRPLNIFSPIFFEQALAFVDQCSLMA